ncbi:hypothetical protein BCR35DRAFT_350729 [Leucosporidium creatinivorum]|uniref:Heme haloperoxidase family profile domain-containing protein n=1 Tax=Leucosporidium creatinivorum TaxID=106004 RepID=A0A1Y2G1L6_9BASI|nr:hypothetical protein BCR35DRAFT_350729 [Leucosporidium creatinivorum]
MSETTERTSGTPTGVPELVNPAINQRIVSPWMFPLSGGWRMLSALGKLTFTILFILVLHTVDTAIFLVNLVWPSRSAEALVPGRYSPENPPPFSQRPLTWVLCCLESFLGDGLTPTWITYITHWEGIGHDGRWEHSFETPPQGEGAMWSRCPCPAINAMANHGIIPRDGRHITPIQLAAAVHNTYNLSLTLSIQLLAAFYPFYLERGWFDIEDLGGQGVIQHDGSFLREDVNSPWAFPTVIGTQARPSQRLIERYFPASNTKDYTWQNHSAILAHRRADSRNHNGTFVLNPLQYVFSSGNSALIHEVVGGKMHELRPWIGANEYGWEMHIDGFQPKCKQGWGMSILQLQIWTAIIELGAGSLSGPRFPYKNDIDAYQGWNADQAKAGAEVN